MRANPSPDPDPTPNPNPDPDPNPNPNQVLQRLQALLDAGRIDNYEAAALLREVSPP